MKYVISWFERPKVRLCTLKTPRSESSDILPCVALPASGCALIRGATHTRRESLKTGQSLAC
jgi:hypothetical protein